MPSDRLRNLAKSAALAAATLAVVPNLISFALRRRILGSDRAIEGSSQALSLVPGIPGQYLRRAFFARTLGACHPSVTIEFGVLFSKADARIDEHVYIGPRCHIGLVHLERDVLIGPAVHIPSGPRTHGSDDPTRPMREQEGTRARVVIGAGCWVGANAVVLADVGANTIVGAGSVVTRALPPGVLAAGVPAQVVRTRAADSGSGSATAGT